MTTKIGTEEKNRSLFTIISYSVVSFGAGAATEFIMAYGLPHCTKTWQHMSSQHSDLLPAQSV